MPQDRRRLPVAEAAGEAEVGRSTVFRYIAIGLLKAHKRVRHRRAYVDLDELLELKRSPPFVR